MAYVFPPRNQPSIPIHGSDLRFPVRRIYCVGQNYAAHAREMGSDPQREPPFFFTKPADAIVPVPGSGENLIEIAYPPRTAKLHHEIELVAAIGVSGRNISPGQAAAHVFGFAVGVDLTRRDLQEQAKASRRPWDTSKGFDASAPISRLHAIKDCGWLDSGRVWLDVNGQRRQDGNLSELTWSVSEVIAELSTYFELQAGDLVFTGTPSGVGELKPRDVLEGGVDGLDTIKVRVE